MEASGRARGQEAEGSRQGAGRVRPVVAPGLLNQALETVSRGEWVVGLAGREPLTNPGQFRPLASSSTSG